MNKDTVLFDMDGTLLDTLVDLHLSVNYALERCGLPRATLDETRVAAGYGSIVLMDDLSGHAFPTDSAEFEALLDAFAGHYFEHHNDNTGPYDGIVEMLAGLKERGYKMAVVSNKIHPDTEALREHWFADTIDVAIGRRDGIAPKPAPDMALAVLELLGSRPEQAYFVGDSEPDIETAVNARCTSVGVSWGFRSRETLEEMHPDYIIEHPLQLLDIVDGVWQR